MAAVCSGRRRASDNRESLPDRRTQRVVGDDLRIAHEPPDTAPAQHVPFQKQVGADPSQPRAAAGEDLADPRLRQLRAATLGGQDEIGPHRAARHSELTGSGRH
ncbi:hypothetical protein ACWDY4_03600 [Streptomyces olivaceoviridis]